MKRRLSAIMAALVVPVVTGAQQAAPDTTKPAPPPTPPAATTPSLPPIDFSGVIYANYQYRGEGGINQAQNKFDLERAYLTFRMPAGDKASIRITADVFQQTNAANDAFYRGWVVRAKYAYLQYDFVKNPGFGVLGRVGLLHNVVIDHIESFWPRWISQTAVERAGFFSSSDAGVATSITLPNKLGEIYASVVNGPGYTSRETDRFKDYSARLSLTPFGNSANRFLKAFALTGWTYQGAIGSRFAAGGAGQVGRVGLSLPRTRSGAFVGVRDPRLSAGFEVATRKDGGETGANTLASPRVEIDSTGRLLSGFAVVKPFQLLNAKSTFPLGLVGRWDRFKPNSATSGYLNTIIGGLTWDLNKRSAISFDYQEVTPKSGLAGTAPIKTYFMHVVANF